MLRLDFFNGKTQDDHISNELLGLEYEIKCIYLNQDITNFTYEAFEKLVDEHTPRYIIDIDFSAMTIEKVRLNIREISKSGQSRYDSRMYKYPVQGQIEMFMVNNCGANIQKGISVDFQDGALYVGIYTPHAPQDSQHENMIINKLKEFHEFASINIQITNNKTKKAINAFKEKYTTIKQDILFEQNIVNRMKNMDM